ncbi:hypothetical protein V2J09_014146 [Rumex salicifolius]
MGKFIHNSKPYVAMICLQFGYAGMNILTKLSLNNGMSHYVLVVYRHAFATAVIAPFALLIERKARPKINFSVFIQIFMLGLLGPVIDQNLYYKGLKLTSPTFSCAMSNMLPAMAFIMAVLCRMEKVDIKRVRCQAKILGTTITVVGAMLMTLYKGPVVELFWTKKISRTQNPRPNLNDQSNWFEGSILLIVATLAWAAFFILQAKTLKVFKDHQLSLTSMVCFMGTLQAVAVTFVMEHKPSGIVTSSISYYVQGLVMKKKGPVFATCFSPLMMIIVAIMGSFILAEKIFLGGVLGSIMIVVGLYFVLWGKHKETVENKQTTDANPRPIRSPSTPTDVDDLKDSCIHHTTKSMPLN